jgi:EamA domain-containing membrane protein RarD
MIITIICFGYAIFVYDDGGGYFSGLGNMLMLVPAGIISTIS